jgi:hypothetical protein
MIVDKYGNYVTKIYVAIVWWGRVDICVTFHLRAFDFFLYWLIQNDCGLVWQLCTKIYLATVWVG